MKRGMELCRDWSLCLLLLMIGGSSFAFQSTDVSNTWIDWKGTEEGKITLTGIFLNGRSQSEALTHEMVFTQDSNNGAIRQVQSGGFTAPPLAPIPLSTFTVNSTEKAAFKVVLKIFKKEQLIASDSLTSSQLELAKQRKSPRTVPLNSALKSVEKHPTTPKKHPAPAVDALEIEGLIIDETRSKAGRDFYDQFYAKWSAPQGVSNFSITIKELPARGRAARVLVKVNDEAVARPMLQPRSDIIELLAEQSVNIVTRHLQNKQKMSKDLDVGDQQGSGIY